MQASTNIVRFKAGKRSMVNEWLRLPPQPAIFARQDLPLRKICALSTITKHT